MVPIPNLADTSITSNKVTMTTSFRLAWIVIALNAVCGAAFVAPRSVAHSRISALVELRATAAEAISTLDASQQTSVNAIAAAIPDLASKPDLSWTGEPIAGSAAVLDGRDAPGPANIAWLSSLCIPSKVSSLTIFNGPLTNVPHLSSRCCIVGDDKLSFALDFRPRAYGAYEMVDADGNYPGPDVLGRQAFEYSGARSDYSNKFGNDEVAAFMQSLSFEGAVRDDAAPSELELLTRGPLALSVTMPLTDANVAAVAAAREKAAAYWLGWQLDDQHRHRPGAPINSQFVYDTKYRQNSYGAILPVYTALFGDVDGAKVAAAESGPLDEGYVGGGS